MKRFLKLQKVIKKNTKSVIKCLKKYKKCYKMFKKIKNIIKCYKKMESTTATSSFVTLELTESGYDRKCVLL